MKPGLKLEVREPAAAAGTEIDPVCGMRVAPERAAGRFEYEGTTYFFCSPGCLAKFRADPERYLAPGAKHEAMGQGAATPAAPEPSTLIACSSKSQSIARPSSPSDTVTMSSSAAFPMSSAAWST